MTTESTISTIEDTTTGEVADQIYIFLSRAFSYPKGGLHDFMRKEGINGEIRGMVEGLPFKMGFKDIPPISLPQDDLEMLYVNLFDIPFAPCPLYESFHRREEESKDDILESLIRFFEHFGVGLSAKDRDYPDQLSAELEFMAYLIKKEQEAIKGGKDPTSFQLAQRDFLLKHLSRWVKRVESFIHKSKLMKEPFYKGLSSFMAGFVSAHLRDLNQKIKPKNKEA